MKSHQPRNVLYALQFKYWLEDQEKAGVTEYNGIKLADITEVPVRG